PRKPDLPRIATRSAVVARRERAQLNRQQEDSPMKRLFTLALIVCVAAAVALADTKMKKGAKPAGTKAGLQQVADDYFAGIKASDAKKLADYFAPDYSYTDLDGKMMNRDERLKSIAALDNSKTVFSDINVRTYGPTGVVTGMAT